MESNNKRQSQESTYENDNVEMKQNQEDNERMKEGQNSAVPLEDAGTGKLNTEEKKNEGNDHEWEEKEKRPSGKIPDEIKNKTSDGNIINFYINEYRNEINNGFKVGNNTTIGDVNFQMNTVTNGGKNTETSIAKDNKRLREWINKNYFNPSLALLITIAVFHGTPYNWIVKEKDNLYAYLPKDDAKKFDTEAVEKRLEEIGAEICTGEVFDYAGKRQERFIRFADEKDADIIIEYIWLQFPDVRMSIVRWVTKHICKGRNIYVIRITELLSKLADMDYDFFVNQMIPVFYQEKNISVDITLSQILVSLKGRYSKSLLSMLTHWSTQERVHPLLTVLLVAREWNEETILRKAMRMYLLKLCRGFYKDDVFFDHILDFFAIGVRKAFFYRVLIEELYELFFSNNISSKIQNQNIDLFLILFWLDVALLVEDEGRMEEAIFVKMCTAQSKVKNKLCLIWQIVWNTHSYRTEVFQILGEYYVRLNNEMLRQNIRLFIDLVFGKNVSGEIKDDAYKKIIRYSKLKTIVENGGK